jgi:hypothetical protein
MSDANFEVVSYESCGEPKYVFNRSLKGTRSFHQQSCLCPDDWNECYVPIDRMTHCTLFDKAVQIIQDEEFKVSQTTVTTSI